MLQLQPQQQLQQQPATQRSFADYLNDLVGEEDEDEEVQHEVGDSTNSISSLDEMLLSTTTTTTPLLLRVNRLGVPPTGGASPVQRGTSSPSSSSPPGGNDNGGDGTVASRSVVFCMIAFGILYLCWKTRRDRHFTEQQDKLLNRLSTNWDDIVQNFKDNQTLMTVKSEHIIKPTLGSLAPEDRPNNNDDEENTNYYSEEEGSSTQIDFEEEQLDNDYESNNNSRSKRSLRSSSFSNSNSSSSNFEHHTEEAIVFEKEEKNNNKNNNGTEIPFFEQMGFKRIQVERRTGMDKTYKTRYAPPYSQNENDNEVNGHPRRSTMFRVEPLDVIVEDCSRTAGQDFHGDDDDEKSSQSDETVDGEQEEGDKGDPVFRDDCEDVNTRNEEITITYFNAEGDNHNNEEYNSMDHTFDTISSKSNEYENTTISTLDELEQHICITFDTGEPLDEENITVEDCGRTAGQDYHDDDDEKSSQSGETVEREREEGGKGDPVFRDDCDGINTRNEDRTTGEINTEGDNEECISKSHTFGTIRSMSNEYENTTISTLDQLEQQVCISFNTGDPHDEENTIVEDCSRSAGQDYHRNDDKKSNQSGETVERERDDCGDVNTRNKDTTTTDINTEGENHNKEEYNSKDHTFGTVSFKSNEYENNTISTLDELEQQVCISFDTDDESITASYEEKQSNKLRRRINLIGTTSYDNNRITILQGTNQDEDISEDDTIDSTIPENIEDDIEQGSGEETTITFHKLAKGRGVGRGVGLVDDEDDDRGEELLSAVSSAVGNLFSLLSSSKGDEDTSREGDDPTTVTSSSQQTRHDLLLIIPPTGEPPRTVPCECVICLDAYKPGEVVVWSSSKVSTCQHVYHLKCITNYLIRVEGGTCPCCRQDFI